MIYLKILRGTKDNQYWETFSVEQGKGLNLIAALLEIQKKAVNNDGEKTTPVAWESGCLEEVCGACSMLINGVPRQACTALLDEIVQETKKNSITVAPLTKFPLIRDLIVDRAAMFESLKRVRAWVKIDGCYDTGPGPKLTPAQQEVMYRLSTCMTCGCCSESCPQVSEKSSFMGPAPIAQVRLFSIHPTGKNDHGERTRELQKEGGVASCGNAQNCVRVCPKKVPLTDSIAEAGRDTTVQAINDLFGLQERS